VCVRFEIVLFLDCVEKKNSSFSLNAAAVEAAVIIVEEAEKRKK
jgi:hypothetical protein